MIRDPWSVVGGVLVVGGRDACATWTLPRFLFVFEFWVRGCVRADSGVLFFLGALETIYNSGIHGRLREIYFEYALAWCPSVFYSYWAFFVLIVGNIFFADTDRNFKNFILSITNRIHKPVTRENSLFVDTGCFKANLLKLFQMYSNHFFYIHSNRLKSLSLSNTISLKAF